MKPRAFSLTCEKEMGMRCCMRNLEAFGNLGATWSSAFRIG